MTATIIKFPWRDFPVTAPKGSTARIYILPVVHIERGISPNDLLMIAAANFIAARRRNKLKKLPKVLSLLR